MMNHRRSEVLEVRRAAAHKARGVVWALVVVGLSAATATAEEAPNFAAPLDAASAQKADLECC